MAPRPGKEPANDWTHFQQFLEDFQENSHDEIRRTLAELIQAGVQVGVQASLAANAPPVQAPQRQRRNNNPVFEEQDHESDADNPFGDDVNNRHQQQYCGH